MGSTPVSFWLSRAESVLGATFLLVFFMGGQTSTQAPRENATHLPNDWSHRHLVFSAPANYWQAVELQKETRYSHQYLRQHVSSLIPTLTSPNHGELEEQRDEDNRARRPMRKRQHKDWAVSLGAGAFMAAGQFPAKFTFDVNATPSCTADYVAFTTSVSSALQIVGFDDLYATQGSVGGFCNANGPSVKWAYDTRIAGDVTGTTLTSPVLSLDGTKLAYVESRTTPNGGSILQILKWKPGSTVTVQGSIATPATPDTRLAAGQNWATNCPAANSCVRSIVFNGANADTNSSPFYNYGTDALYVGDDSGLLHKFTGVFLGTPAEVIGSGWPVSVNATAILTAPVLDFTSRNIFVGDNTGRLSFVREVGSTVGACAAGSPPCLGSISQPLTGSIVDPPIVDGSTERLLVFDGTETSGNDGSVFQFDTGLTTASKVTVRIGGNQGTTPTAVDALHAGAFDDAYYSVGPGSGHLYTCGKDPGFNNRPALYRLAFNNAGVLQTTGIPAPLVNLTATFSLIGDACSPVIEIKNGATDRIFFSLAINANPTPPGTATGCTATQGCVASIVLGGAWPPAATTAGIAVPFILTGVQTGSGGTSGIVVDNVGAGAQESSIYYTFRGNSTAAVPCNGTVGVGCAVKATQSTLN